MQRVKGFTLVEVLVASLIIMMGVVGYVTLQSTFFSSDQKLALRQQGLKLAREKMDDLRSFTQVDSAAGVFAFADIGNDSGGDLPSGSVAVQVTERDGDLVRFTRSWSVVDEYYVDTDMDGQADSWLAAGAPGLPTTLPAVGQKQVVVTVSWTDPIEGTKSVNLAGKIAPVPQGLSYHALNEADDTKKTPQVAYTPGQAPDVISYDIGNNEKIETSKPVPDIDNQGDNNIVKFETIKYTEVGLDVDKLEQEDFLTVNCSCRLAGEGEGKTPSMTVLEGEALTTSRGEFITKMTGEPANAQQPDICTACCRDHHDTAGMITEEQYYREEGGQPHKHYKRQANGSYTLASSVGNAYDEVCRFKRVDGYYEIYPDWQLADIIAFDDKYLLDEVVLDNYRSYTEGLIASKISGGASPAKPADRDLTLAPGGYQLIARGIYLDRMKSSHQAEVLAKIQANNPVWKAITPFYDVNLTLLSEWASNDVSIATVSQEAIKTIVDPNNDFYGTYSRGRLEALADGTTTVSVSGYGFNAGITGTGPVSASEEATALSDNLTITVDSKSAAEKFYAIIGDINCVINTATGPEPCETNNTKKSTYVNLAAMSVVADPNQYGCVVTVPKGRATPFFSCENVSENWTGELVFNLTVPGYTVSLSVRYPDGSIVQANDIDFTTGLTGTSNKEYSVIVTLD